MDMTLSVRMIYLSINKVKIYDPKFTTEYKYKQLKSDKVTYETKFRGNTINLDNGFML